MTETTVAYHRDGPSDARPAINVKVHGYAGVEHGKLYATLGEQRADSLYEIAEEQVYGRFWDDAHYMAADLGLGEIEQEGRSGGWLVFMDGRDPQNWTTFDSLTGHAALVKAWLVAYREMAEWCAEQVAAAPGRVARLAQQLAMDEIGAEPARRMWMTFPLGDLPVPA